MREGEYYIQGTTIYMMTAKGHLEVAHFYQGSEKEYADQNKVRRAKAELLVKEANKSLDG